MKKKAMMAAMVIAGAAMSAETQYQIKAEGVEIRDAKWEGGKDPKFSFTAEVKEDCVRKIAVVKLPPSKFFLHSSTVAGKGGASGPGGGWCRGLYTVEEIAKGIDVELEKGITRLEFNKHGGSKVSMKDWKKWQGMRTEIKSTYDGTMQPIYFEAPKNPKDAVPLIIGMHTWSGDIMQLDHYKTVCKEAEKRGWAFVGPNFRGPNKTPPACGGEAAVQDIVDAIEYAKRQVKIDEKRIYIVGGSGGGHMTLLMLGRHPEIFAAGAAFCPITDLARWHADSDLKHPGRSASYARMMEGACGGTPKEQMEEYKKRSPLTWLKRAKEAAIPTYICTGIHDGWAGSVPVGHAIRGFNALCEKGDEISEKEIAEIEATQAIPSGMKTESKEDPFYNKNIAIHLRRTSGNVRLTLFEGGHGGNFQAAFDFLARQEKGKKADWTIPASGKGSEEKLTK